jgi:hypothetical protein
MDTVMRRSRFAPFALLLLALISLPVAARTSTLSNASEDTATCPDAGTAADDPADPANKSTTTKRAATPAATKAHPAARGSDAVPGRAPRWHRFLPGMYR